MKLGLLFASALLVACPQPPLAPAPPPTDADAPETAIGRACHRLREIGCPEGFPNRIGRTCAQVLAATEGLGLVVPAACLSSSRSEEAVRRCGDANTIRVRCVMPTASELGSEISQ